MLKYVWSDPSQVSFVPNSTNVDNLPAFRHLDNLTGTQQIENKVISFLIRQSINKIRVRDNALSCKLKATRRNASVSFEFNRFLPVSSSQEKIGRAHV